MTRFEIGTEGWKGQGKPIFYRHLRQAMAEGLPIRVIVATTDDPHEIFLGNAARTNNDFEPVFEFVGRVTRLEDDYVELEFEHTGIVPEVAVTRRNRSSVKYWHVAEAVEALGKPSSTQELQDWLAQHYPDVDHSDLSANLSFLTVNDANRRHYDKARKRWRSDSGHPRDRLFRQGRMRATTYEPFRPSIHGQWDLRQNDQGVWAAVALPRSATPRPRGFPRSIAGGLRPPSRCLARTTKDWLCRLYGCRRSAISAPIQPT